MNHLPSRRDQEGESGSISTGFRRDQPDGDDTHVVERVRRVTSDCEHLLSDVGLRVHEERLEDTHCESRRDELREMVRDIEERVDALRGSPAGDDRKGENDRCES